MPVLSCIMHAVVRLCNEQLVIERLQIAAFNSATIPEFLYFNFTDSNL